MSNSSKEFIDSVSKAFERIDYHAGRMLVEHMREKEKLVKHRITEELTGFFFQMSRVIGDKQPTWPSDAPVRPFWKNLSERWLSRKKTAENQFYVGKTGALKGYLEGMKGTNAAIQAFGPVQTRVVARHRNGTTGELERVVLGEKNRLYAFKQGPKGWTPTKAPGTSKPMTATIEVTAFPKLKGMRGGEWHAVDMLVNSTGSREWIKVNARRRGNWYKPRPLVLPMIQWYSQVRLRKVLRNL